MGLTRACCLFVLFVVQGVRQCGKTFLIKQFAERYYDDVVYYRFDKDAKIKGFIEQVLYHKLK